MPQYYINYQYTLLGEQTGHESWCLLTTKEGQELTRDMIIKCAEERLAEVFKKQLQNVDLLAIGFYPRVKNILNVNKL